MKKQKEAMQSILDICKDGTKGYAKAAADVENAELKTIFNRLAQQRKLFIEELKNDARDLGLELDESANSFGFFHRVWIDIRSTFASHETTAIIEEAKKGEKGAAEVYTEALASELPAYVKERLDKQRHLITGCITQLNEFEVAFS